jgi:copper(I)-binding protein
MKPFQHISTLLVGLLLLTACGPSELTVTDAWARPADQGSTSAIYFVINNPLDTEDTLLRAEANVSEAVEIHQTSIMDMNAESDTKMEGGDVMQMMPVDRVPVPAGGSVTFEPGGFHVMLVNLNQALEPGAEVSLHLFFENAGEITLTVPVEQR